MADRSNVARGRRFREMTALYLASRGLEGARPRETFAKLSEALLADDTGEPGDILGVPGWTFVTRCEYQHDLSESLDAAAALGRDSGRRGALIQWRRSRRIGDQYAVLRLDDFAALVGERQGVLNKI